jgi:hypothetical protein
MIFPGESDWKFRPPQRSQVFSVDVPNLPSVRSSLSVGFDRLATSVNEVDLTVSLLECTIGVSPFGRWRMCSLFTVVVVLAFVVVLATSIIASVVVTIIVAIVTTITSVTPVGAVVTTVVVASFIAAIVTVIITLIPIVIARIGYAVTVISSIKSTVTIVEVLTTIAVVIVVSSGLLGGRWYPKGML